MPKVRKNYTPDQKVAMLRRHLVDRIPVSELCEEYRLQPTVFYRWLKTFFENGAVALQNKAGKSNRRNEQEIAALKAKLQAKNEVLAELMEEHVALKKSLGDA